MALVSTCAHANSACMVPATQASASGYSCRASSGARAASACSFRIPESKDNRKHDILAVIAHGAYGQLRLA